jgi:hypothetical protein
LKEYVEACNRQEPNNDQTRLLAGRSAFAFSAESVGLSRSDLSTNCEPSNFESCPDEMLGIAKRNLAECFAVVGITEEFDRSLILMKRILGWRNPFYVSQNVSRRRPRKEGLPVETLRVIQAYNALDIELYRYARELFREQIRLQGNSFEIETQMFRKLNASYGRLGFWLSSAIKQLRGRRLTSRSFQPYE